MGNNKKPLVSVIMPVYNSAEYVTDTINSILGQTYKNFEFIIVDDASSDEETKIILREFASNYQNIIKVIFLKKNRGSGGDAAANFAYRASKGEFIARIDSDDIAHAKRIEKQVSYMINHPDCAVLGTSAFIINSKNEVVGEKIMPVRHKDIYKNYFILHPMINPTVMVRRSLMKNTGNDLYLTDTPPNNDYLTGIKRISEGARFHNLPNKLMYYRIHDGNDSLKNVRKTFKNSVRTRIRAVSMFGYKPGVESVIKFAIQAVLVFTLPQRVTFNLYLLVKGIKKPNDYFSGFRDSLAGRLKKAFNFFS